MQAKAHVSVPFRPKVRPQKNLLAAAWTKFRQAIVMDAPESWDVHPDVLRKLDARLAGTAGESHEPVG